MPRPLKRCAGCREHLNPNAFPRGSSLCYPCRDARARRQRADSNMPSELQALGLRIDDIEADNDWEHRFVCDLIERFELGRILRLSPRQAAVVERIADKHGLA